MARLLVSLFFSALMLMDTFADPVIDVQPSNRTNRPGTSAMFSVTANGTAPLSYQWTKYGNMDLEDGGNISGAKTATLTIANVSQSDEATYSVVVSNGIGSVVSSLASLSLLYPNDNFSGSSSLSGTDVPISGSTSLATREPDEQVYYSSTNYIGRSLWWSWMAPCSGSVVISNWLGYLGVFSGNDLLSLSKVAGGRYPPKDGQLVLADGGFDSRLVFKATAGITYRIVLVDGRGDMRLTCIPPPMNDAIASSTVIPGSLFVGSGSIIGASREPGEPTHNDLRQQTLWWSWTPPPNAGPSNSFVRIETSRGSGFDPSFLPSMTVYTGNVLSNLLQIPFALNGTFTASIGTTYRIVLVGNESSSGADSASYAQYWFRLHSGFLGISITNLSSSYNPNSSKSFIADAQIDNIGLGPTGPLRVRVVAVSANSGAYDLGAFYLPPPGSLSPGTVLVAISGVIPRPFNHPGGTFVAYALVEEQMGDQWFLQDEVFIDHGAVVYNDLTGGGVVILQPGLGGSDFVGLNSVTVIGPASVNEGSAASFFGRAIFSDQTTNDFTQTEWSSSLFSISNGLFTAGKLSADVVVSIGTKYTFGGIPNRATTDVNVINLPPPQFHFRSSRRMVAGTSL